MTNNTPLRVLVLGAGATGGVFGGALAIAEELGFPIKVSFLVREKRAQLLREKGLIVRGPPTEPQGGFVVKHPRLVVGEVREPTDLVLLTSKAFDLEQALDAIRPTLEANPSAVLVPVLNGMRHLDLLDNAFGRERVAGGTCKIISTIHTDGSIARMSALKHIYVGSRALSEQGQQRQVDVLTRFVGALNDPRIAVGLLSENIEKDLWAKFTLLTTLAGVTCLFRGAMGDVMKTQQGQKFIELTLSECARVAERSGYKFPQPELDSMRSQLMTDPHGILTSSMLRDLESGGPIEGDHIVGDMLFRARELSQPGDPRLQMLPIIFTHLETREFRKKRENMVSSKV